MEAIDLQNSSRFDRLQSRSTSQSMMGTEAVAAHAKLIVLGKPGSGKTTFLQALSLQYSQGENQGDQQTRLLPIYISLRHFALAARQQADFRLELFISQQWIAHGLTQAQIETLLQQGQVLVLLDGLDEVSLADSGEVCAHIQKFAETYGANSIVLTSRIAAQEYCFRGFTYVEMADFDDSQIALAVYKWFAATNLELAAPSESAATGLAKAEQFLEKLQYSENQPIRELVATPILLHLACLVFQARSTFPNHHARLYQAGLDILLVRWDSARGICRDSVCPDLTLSDKINILSRIAAVMFEQGKLFFEKGEVLQVIAEYLRTLPTPIGDVEALWLNSEAVLRAIALQHGLLVERARDVYSFSHLTFQEYLTAKHIVASLATAIALP
ncbi:MAG: NACHT domain-containing protein [Cyanobacteria bacterium CRU_2_1]|nr:NACHT domain-containing protein [Cyanobacteria bacterium CRU_2_1]